MGLCVRKSDKDKRVGVMESLQYNLEETTSATPPNKAKTSH